jgi:two-component system, cell cycle response regulator
VPLALTIQPGTTTIAGQLPSLDPADDSLSGSLLVIAGAPADIGRHVLVEGEVVVGREPVGMQLRDARCSRKHCAIRPQDAGFELIDLGSTNGTALNNVPVKGPPVPLHDGDKIYLGETVLKFTLVDETEAQYLRRMEQLAGKDSLTGLLAKHRFDSLLADAFRTAHATRTPLCVMMMDMDGLKAINDRHGHHMGAHTIRSVGKLLGTMMEGVGEASRFGGDEFCAILPGHDLRRAIAVAERFREGVEAAEYTLGSVVVHATISVGVAEIKDDTLSGVALLNEADQALYRSKAKGRNNVSD